MYHLGKKIKKSGASLPARCVMKEDKGEGAVVRRGTFSLNGGAPSWDPVLTYLYRDLTLVTSHGRKVNVRVDDLTKLRPPPVLLPLPQ